MNNAYLTRKFTDIYPNVNVFTAGYMQSPLGNKITQDSCNTLYYLLYARYGNSTIASIDENQFQFKVYSIIFQYGPTWEKELSIQDAVRALNVGDADLEEGSTKIYNAAQNPDVAPSDQTLQELQYISNQNVSKTKRGKVEQYAIIEELMKRDVSDYFLNKFKPLFLTVVAPTNQACYCNECSIEGQIFDCGCEV